MRITEIIKEDQELDELSLAGVGQGIKKAAGVAGRGAVAGIKGISKAAGYVPGAITGIKQQYAAGKAAGASRFGTGTPPAPSGTPPPASGTPPPSGTPPAPSGTPPPDSGTPPAPSGTPPAPSGTPPASTNPFSDPVELKQSFDSFLQSGGTSLKLKPVIKSIWMQLGGTRIEGAQNNKAPVVEFYSKFLGGNI